MHDSKPAVILIMADELRQDSLSCYGGRAINTPHLDSLACSGTRFEKAYANSPWCLPSRSSLITGLFPHNHGAYSNFRQITLQPDQPNLYNVLRRGGYHVCHVGKCHYAPVPYGRANPHETLPYEEFRRYYLSLGIAHLALQDDKQVSVWFMDDYARELQAAGYLEGYRSAVWNRSWGKVFTFPGPANWHPDSWVGRKAAQAIEEYEGDSPFFGFVSFSGPHFPFDPPAQYLARVDMENLGTGCYREGELDDPSRIHHRSYHGPGGIEGSGAAGRPCKDHPAQYWQDLRRNYFANVALIDDQVGAILSAVERRFGNNALVIFTADHGEMLGNHRLWGKNNCAYEDVLKVPLLVKYPGLARSGSTDAMVMLIDVMPTILAVAGVDQPTMDGTDLRTLVENGGRRYIVSEGDNFVAVSDGNLKYVRTRTKWGEYTELFDLVADPGEFENVACKPGYAPGLARLQEALIDRFMDCLLR